MHTLRTHCENTRDLANTHRINTHLEYASPRTPCCHMHPEKPATHALPQAHASPLPCCEKCSIMLASKGHNILRIAALPTKSYRQQQIEEFLGELSWHLAQLSRRQWESEQTLRGSEAYFAGLLQQAGSFFKEMEELLEVQKYLSYNAILNQRAAAESELRLARETLQQELQELAGIGSDIQNNMEAVEQVERQIYESIMHNYRIKAAAAAQLHQIQLPLLPRPALTLPDIPKVLYSLADKLTLRGDGQGSVRQSVSGQVGQGRASCSPRPGQHRLSSLANLKNAESIDDKEHQIVFSFESNEQEHPLQKALFGRRDFLPQEMLFRESLSLTEIRENEEEEPQVRRYGGMLQQTIPIPEEMVGSQESIAGYFATNSLNDRGEDTETLLIC